MNLETANEIARVEDALYRFCATRQWEIRSVTFPSTANTDLDIAHGLSPTTDDGVDFLVLKKSRPCDVYAYGGSDRVSWSRGVVRLRCTAPSATVILLLSVSDDPASRTLPETTSHNIEIPEGTSDDHVTIGTVGTSAGVGAVGPGVQITHGSNVWALVAYAGPLGAGSNNRALAIQDLTGGTAEMPFLFWRYGAGGTYFFSPDDTTNTTDACSLGDIQQSSGAGRWDRLYAKGIDVGTLSVDNSASGVISALNGYRERARSVALGEWTSPTFSAGNFTANPGTWTVDSGDVVTYAYTLVGKTMTVAFAIAGTDIATAPTQLRIAIPGGFTAAKRMDSVITYVDAGAAATQGIAYVSAAGSTINIEKNSGAAFTNTTADNTNVVGQLTFEVS